MKIKLSRLFGLALMGVVMAMAIACEPAPPPIAQEPANPPAQTEEVPAEPAEEVREPQTAEPPTATPVPPTETPTAEPTEALMVEPTIEPTQEPAAEPTQEPTAEPSVEPTATPVIEPTALPFTLEFALKSYPAETQVPALQSFAVATTADGKWLLLGGRFQGLHTFQEDQNNFPASQSNTSIWVIDPNSGEHWQFDTNQLPPDLSAPLQATNQQYYFDRAADQLYISGGYGWTADQSDMRTFRTLLRLPVTDLVNQVTSAQPDAEAIAAMIEVGNDDRFGATGGELARLGSRFYLVFGQIFDGQYRAFSGGGSTPFTQEYTEQVGVFTLIPDTLEINSYGALTSGEPDQPFHRRDGNFIEDIDPATGQERISAYGGVFPPGKIAGYQEPIHIQANNTVTIAREVKQAFSQYECPVIPVFDDTAQAMYNTFFGGISATYYHETAEQRTVREKVTAEGRNDGLPFIADISTLVQAADGSYREYILPQPIPAYRLVGTSTQFILNPALVRDEQVYGNGTIRLSAIPQGERLLVGHIFGGIESDFPLPLVPNEGTHATNAIYEVYLTHTPSGAIPAQYGIPSEINDSNLNRE